ncbi:MAG: secondary thiamine-phosphate synthase enzyme YjbQ [Desulfurococcaceae archaeon]|nr:secondary thiamine-phosphate synthase enzyme YjbQ [Desulfurococcaceae archaeon]
MKVYYEVLKLNTTSRFQLLDITGDVENTVKRSSIRNGIVVVHAPHATASIIVNEHEPGLLEDILEKVKEFTEPGSSKWRHNRIDDNAHAHIGSALFGSTRIFPVVNGRVVRGTWQNIFFLEMDGPRSVREITVLVMGE